MRGGGGIRFHPKSVDAGIPLQEIGFVHELLQNGREQRILRIYKLQERRC